MGKTKTPIPVKLFLGMLSSAPSLLDDISAQLSREFGDIHLSSPICDFNFTNYYESEMGNPLWRRFVAFQPLIDPALLKSIKIATNDLENKLASSIQGISRAINLDPGYLCLSKIILATTKDYSHRIYLGEGIYAEITLRYQNKRYVPCEWTYPDYRSAPYLSYFSQLRELYLRQLREMKAY